MLSKHEPKGQHWLVKILFVAILIVAVGSITGEWLGIKNMLGNLWFWFGHQGWEYLELGRVWQILLTLGMVLWAVIVFRSIRPLLKGQDKGGLPYMLLLWRYGHSSLFFQFWFDRLKDPQLDKLLATIKPDQLTRAEARPASGRRCRRPRSRRTPPTLQRMCRRNRRTDSTLDVIPATAGGGTVCFADQATATLRASFSGT